MEEINEDDVWSVIGAYFREESLVHHQLSSFEEFIEQRMSKTVQKYGQIRIESKQTVWKINFKRINVGRPTFTEVDGQTRDIYPEDARRRDLTYAAPLYTDVAVTVTKRNGDVTQNEFTNLCIGKVPIMLQSRFCLLYNKSEEELTRHGECLYDKGGYFILNGCEKVLIAQERTINNHIFVFKGSQPRKYTHEAEIRSAEETQEIAPRAIYVKMCARSTRGVKSIGGLIRATLPLIRSDIPIFIVLRALGFVCKDKEMLQLICYDITDTQMMELLLPSLEEASSVQTQKVALDYIGKRGNTVGESSEKRIKFAERILDNEFLPHIGGGHTYRVNKSYYFGWIIHKLLLCILGRIREDDRNHFGNKRLDLAGPLLGGLFGTLFRELTREMRSYAEKCVRKGKELDMRLALNPQIITRGFNYSIAIGNWGKSNAINTRVGVSQALNRCNYVSTLSHLRRLTSPLSRPGLVKPRALHSTQWGMICPTETPEGKACGLMKNLALMARVTVNSPAEDVIEILEENGIHELSEVSFEELNESKVFLNGCWIGFHRDPKQLVSVLRDLKRSASVDTDLGVVWNVHMKEIRLYTDYGRCRRPLFTVNDQRLLIKKKDIEALDGKGSPVYGVWGNLLKRGLIEYLDVEEEEFALISMTIDELEHKGNAGTYTHCEIHPSLQLGVCASIIPFPDHNASPRNTFAAAMTKQAIGIYATNYQLRMDVSAHVLFYPQKPLVGTRAMDHLHFRELPAGANAIVAIASYSGYNQGDAIIMNQSSIDRGLFCTSAFRSFTDVEKLKKGSLTEEVFGCPAHDPAHDTCYGKLESDGLPAINTAIYSTDAIIGKMDEKGRCRMKGERISLHEGDTGVVDQVLVTTNRDGSKLAKVRLRLKRVTTIGDKFSSRHGQKGVVGMLLTQENMPRTREGITPDIMINPHGFPSRMTLGQFLESMMGKSATYQGCKVDATPFTAVTVESIKSALHICGYQSSGFETMYDGQTGKLSGQSFIGPTFYQKLKHMVYDKIWSRSRGRVDILTRQPTAGRAHGGGLRFGEMERDCLIGHGASAILKERLFTLSDPFRAYICRTCGLLAFAIFEKQTLKCKGCKGKSKIAQVDMPYAFKLLIQELMAMGIAPRLYTENHV